MDNKKISDYQIMVVERAIKRIGTAVDLANTIGCSASLITQVRKGRRCLSPVLCIKLAKSFDFVNIKRVTDAYSPEIIDWIKHKYKSK